MNNETSPLPRRDSLSRQDIQVTSTDHTERKWRWRMKWPREPLGAGPDMRSPGDLVNARSNFAGPSKPLGAKGALGVESVG